MFVLVGKRKGLEVEGVLVDVHRLARQKNSRFFLLVWFLDAFYLCLKCLVVFQLADDLDVRLSHSYRQLSDSRIQSLCLLFVLRAEVLLSLNYECQREEEQPDEQYNQ